VARRSESGQGTVEWIGLVLVVALAFLAIGAGVGLGVAGADVARAIAAKLVCAARLADTCDAEADALAVQYGADAAALVREHAPTIRYHDGVDYLPVDPDRCREPACASVSGLGDVWRTDERLPATAFTRVIDCRTEAVEIATSSGSDCSGDRAGRIYVQYWLYYPDSRTEPWGERGYHGDDWESLQVRIGTEVDGRASSHRSYNHGGGVRNWASDAGVLRKSGWGPYAGELHVGSASHAGHVDDDERGARSTPAERLRLVPIEPIGESIGGDHDYAVAPPWLKDVYFDPEATGT